MDTSGYQEIFGAPFWNEGNSHEVHAFVAGVNSIGNLLQLEIEILSASSFAANYETHREPISLFESIRACLAIMKLEEVAARKIFGLGEDEPIEGSWRTFRIVANGQSDGQELRLLTSFADTEGQVFKIMDIREIPPEVAESHLTMILGSEVGEDDVRSLINPVVKRELELAVLDVGQGAASFLFIKNGDRHFPVIYFDLGGGIAKNAFTFPTSGVDWCFTQNPPVILSHWHWDHWAGATYGSVANVSKALKATWLAPNQTTGSFTNKFKAKILKAGGRIFYWPASKSHLTIGRITLGIASGTLTNDSGLVLLLQDNDKRYSLLPGDAEYIYIPNAIQEKYKNGLKTLVITHHGGKHGTPVNIPAPDGKGGNHAIYSVGGSNSYGHPTRLNDYSAWVCVGTHQRNKLKVKHLCATTGGAGSGVVNPICGGRGNPNCSLILHK